MSALAAVAVVLTHLMTQRQVQTVVIAHFMAIHQLVAVAVRQLKTGTEHILLQVQKAVALVVVQGLRLLQQQPMQALAE
tara:strand:- start:383 stop:619 length:237 start_codon:yes stop_codon:yes gene_type:complete